MSSEVANPFNLHNTSFSASTDKNEKFLINMSRSNSLKSLQSSTTDSEMSSNHDHKDIKDTSLNKTSETRSQSANIKQSRPDNHNFNSNQTRSKSLIVENRIEALSPTISFQRDTIEEQDKEKSLSHNSSSNPNPVDQINKFDDTDFKEMPKDLNSKLKKFIRALEYICHLKEPYKIVDDQKCYEAFFYVKYLLSPEEKFIENKNWKFLTRINLDDIVVINV
jgi:hypothetical protein